MTIFIAVPRKPYTEVSVCEFIKIAHSILLSIYEVRDLLRRILWWGRVNARAQSHGIRTSTRHQPQTPETSALLARPVPLDVAGENGCV